MKTILAPIDFSPVTDRVIAEATELARAARGRIVLLTALVRPVFVPEFSPQPENLRRVEVDARATISRRLAETQKKLLAKGIPTSTCLLTGDPVRHILEKAKSTAAAYIILGSHGHSALYDLVAGSTAYRVLKHAPCPVLVVPSTLSAPGKRGTRTKPTVRQRPSDRRS